MTTRAKLFSQLAKSVDTSGTITSDGISSTVSLGATVYDSIGELPMSGYSAGEQAFVKSTSRLYINSGVGWYNVAVINNTPTIQSILDSNSGTGPFSLATDGTATTITITAQDSDGDTLTYTASADSDFNGLATISQASNVFTITPFSQDSATTTSGTITFNVTDNINIANSVQTFTLNFVSALWDETVLSIGTSSTNSLDNSTFIDRSTNAHTVTATGTPVQTAFHPYLDNWSVEFDGSGDYLKTASHSSLNLYNTDFTLEGWFYATAPAGNEHIWASYIDVNNRESLYFSNGTTLNWWVNGSARISTTVNAFQWYHFAVVDNSGTTTLYIDGVSQGTWTNTYTDGSRLAWIGTYQDVVTPTDAFTGYISNVRFVRGTALYTSNFTPPTEKLTAVSGTSLLTCQSNRVIDNSTNGYTITSAGNAKISAFNPFGQESEYAVGENKGSAVFPSTGTKLELGEDTSFAFGTGDYTVEFWYYSNASSGGTLWGTIFDTSTSAAYIGSLFITASPTDGQTLIVYQNGGTRASGTTSGKNLQAGEWTHCAVTRESGTINIWINGVLDGTGSGTDDLTLSHATVGGTTYWAGAYDMRDNDIISDLKVIKGTAVYTSAFTPPTAPVGNTNASLYLPMDNAGIFDKTGNNTISPNSVVTQTADTVYASSNMYFNGSTFIRLESPLHQILDNEEFTLEFWIKITESETRCCIFGIGDHSTNDLSFFCQNDGLFKLHPYGGYSSVYNSLWDGAWHHFAVSRGVGTIRSFIDGTQVASFSSTNDYGTTAQVLNIGYLKNFAGYNLMGYIENFQFIRGVAKYTTDFTPPVQTQGRQYQAES